MPFVTPALPCMSPEHSLISWPVRSSGRLWCTPCPPPSRSGLGTEAWGPPCSGPQHAVTSWPSWQTDLGERVGEPTCTARRTCTYSRIHPAWLLTFSLLEDGCISRAFGLRGPVASPTLSRGDGVEPEGSGTPRTCLLLPGFDGVVCEHTGGGDTPEGSVSQATRGADGPFRSKGWDSEST